ncbi:hypothetical protein [Marinisporobacter balticus]|uniref:Uncharacterized protein n=1 Tax=Marinisporobacter balticus TaxID=2018667 RepID=A0A4V2S9P0_9FIRM|nr:hypothetical protein [Marinisporobacter balticus]TCO68100.1 hypothetical protein EV214_14811 [Marinisporobacter balticus]
MGMTTSYKRAKMYVYCSKQALINMKWDLRDGISDLEALIASTGVSALGFINPVTGILAFSLTTAYGLMSVCSSDRALATTLERKIDTMNNRDYAVLKFEVELAYSVSDLVKDKPSSMEVIYLDKFRNIGSTRFNDSELIEYINNNM